MTAHSPGQLINACIKRIFLASTLTAVIFINFYHQFILLKQGIMKIRFYSPEIKVLQSGKNFLVCTVIIPGIHNFSLIGCSQCTNSGRTNSLTHRIVRYQAKEAADLPCAVHGSCFRSPFSLSSLVFHSLLLLSY